MQKTTTFVGQVPEKFSQKRKVPKVSLIIVAIIAGAVGAYALIHSFAAPTQPSIYWGAWMDGDTYGGLGDAPWDSTTWNNFEQHAGKKVSIDHYGQPPMWSQAFSASTANLVTNRGAIPLMDMSSQSVPLTDITSGKYDPSITSWANAAKAWGKPFFFRWNWEMNGTWFNWGAQAKQNPAAFVAAWRHMHDLISQAGATNVTWVWCPNTVFTSSTDLNQLYPGSSYVDWTCVDGYNKSPLDGDSWKSFSQIFQSTYNQLLTIAPSKPIMIGETASNENGGSKATWITDALQTQLPNNYPQVKAFVWFNWPISEYESSVNATVTQQWPIESSSGAQAAFASGIASPVYSTNTFGSLPALTKVQPLSDQSTIPPPDTSAPTVSLTAPAGNTTVSGTSTAVSATASDNTGVAGVQFKLDGNNLGSEDTSSPYSIAWNTTSATNGAHTLTAVARDAAGNMTTAPAVTVNVSNATPDTTPPDTTITAGPGSSTTSTSASFSFVSSESNSTFACQLDGGSFGACTSPKAYTGLSVGTHTFSVRATDAANNQDATPAIYAWTITNTPDTTSPSVNFTSPASNSTVSGTVTATAGATDNVSVTKVEISLDGTLKMTDTASPYNYSFDSKALNNGSHTLTAKAYDQAGNSNTASITVNVSNPDTTPPSTPTNLSATAANATTVNLAWTASTDSGSSPSGVAKYNVLRNGAVIAQTTTTSYTDAADAANTTYTYTVQAVDAAGNISANSNTATVTTPTVPDTVPPTTPTGLQASAASTSQVNLSWNASTDSGGSGIAGYNVYRGGVKLNSSLVTTTSYGDSTVSSSTTYSYQVEAVDGAGNKSAKTASVSVTTPSGAHTRRQKPGGGKKTAAVSTTISQQIISQPATGETATTTLIAVLNRYGKPVKGAAVTIASQQTIKTDKDGIARFTGIPSGPQTIAVNYRGKKMSEVVQVKGASKPKSLEAVKVSITTDKFNPALLLIPVLVLLAAGGFFARPWERFAQSSVEATEEQIVTSNGPAAAPHTPTGRKLETPGSVYSPHNPDNTDPKN